MLAQAEREARSVAHQWRVANGIPITDPRFLEATEDDALMDLLISGIIRRAQNPNADHEDAITDPGYAKRIEDAKKELLGSGALERTIRAMMGGSRKAPEVQKVKVSGRIVSPRKPRRKVRP